MHPNPSPCHGNTFKFCHWNLDSITVNNFPLKEAFNSVYNYDIIAVSETYLASSIPNESISLKADFLSWQKLLATIFFQKKSVK